MNFKRVSRLQFHRIRNLASVGGGVTSVDEKLQTFMRSTGTYRFWQLRSERSLTIGTSFFGNMIEVFETELIVNYIVNMIHCFWYTSKSWIIIPLWMRWVYTDDNRKRWRFFKQNGINHRFNGSRSSPKQHRIAEWLKKFESSSNYRSFRLLQYIVMTL